MQLSDAAQKFIAYIEVERGCTPLTAQAYRGDLRLFQGFLGESQVPTTVEAMSPAILRRYVSHLANAGYKQASIARRIYALSSMFRYLVAFEYTTTNPCAQVVLPKKRNPDRAVLTLDEARRMLEASQDSSSPVRGFRDRAMMAVLLFCGLRRAELLDLRLEDVNVKASYLKVRRGKGVKARSIPLKDDVRDALADWLEFRPKTENDNVFTTVEGRPLSVGGLRRSFARIIEAASIVRSGVSLHTMRHTFACLLLQGGADLVSIQQLLGHNDLATTSIYLQVDAPRLQTAVTLNPLSLDASP